VYDMVMELITNYEKYGKWSYLWEKYYICFPWWL
jgi:hypothetical protein